MKKKGFSVVIAATILSGCTSLMYGGGVAPVNNQNTYYGQKPMAQQVPPQIPVPTQPTVPHTVTTIQTVPPSVGQQQFTQSVDMRQQQIATQVNAPSPYGNAASTPQNTVYPANTINDGWAARPNTPPTATDTPKIEPETPVVKPTQTAQETNSQPVRPPAREEVVSTQTTTPTPPTPTTQPEQKAKPENHTQVASNQPTNQPASNRGAVSTLLQKANSELGKGNLDGAAAYLEDAHRIDSKNANILYDIANIRYHQKRYREAEAAAARAANMGGNNGVMRKSWSLIANARKALGDNQGAIAAAEKAASF